MSDSSDFLYKMRHSTAHLLAAAVLKLWPKARFGVGPVVEEGFYYDIEIPDYKLSLEDLEKIEEEMRKLKEQNLEFKRAEIAIDEAIKLFEDLGQVYKIELLNDLKEHGTTVFSEIYSNGSSSKEQKVDRVSIYTTGDFVDLCRGPHVDSTQDIGVFKLTKLAGAYWRGDENNPQLQRIYGVAFKTEEELEEYLNLQEEIKKRDHRVLGRKLDLFTSSELVGQGLPLFTPKGTIVRDLLQNFVEDLNRQNGYLHVWIPHITKPDLYKVSGHWDKFKDDLFHVQGKDNEFALKPMNCPHHTQIYAFKPRSYRDLPIRFYETTTVYRDEKSGELGGLTRVRCITQDDGHLFIRDDQIEQEFDLLLEMQRKVLQAIGLTDYWIRLSLRDPNNKEAYLGDDEIWEKAQKTMADILEKRGIKYIPAEGEAAFYGPKMDLMVKDSLGREWQLSTIQLDFNMPVRFNLTYTDKEGKDRHPIMIHRAFLGSIERIIGVLIEHFAGAFPLWLSPVQVVLVPVGEGHIGWCRELAKELIDKNIRVEVDVSNETVGNKIRKAQESKVPYMLVVGDKEIESGQLSIRKRSDNNLYKMNKDEFVDMLISKDKNKEMEL